MIPSTMQDRPLTVVNMLRHAAAVHGDAQVITRTDDGYRRSSFTEVGNRTAQLASALTRLGVEPGDRVGTFCWNHQEHIESYLAVPSMGAVLHTLNIRLFPDQLAYIINHAEDKIIIVDDSLVPLLARVAPDLKSVKQFIVIGNGPAAELGPVLRYEELLADERPEFNWPEMDERSAAAMCYTSGTTGNPKGVVYSHRSTYLHSLSVCSGSTFGLSHRDKILIIVPMFHANAWGMPYSGWMVGADLLMPNRFLQAEPLSQMIESERPTFSGAVPTIWNDILHYSETHPVDLSSFRMLISGGSAVPRSLIERFHQKHGVMIVQAWGMTETSPLAAVSHPPRGINGDDEFAYRARSGRVNAGVEMRVTDGEKVLPWDGESVGELEIRGPWITSSYYGDDTPEKFHDGWLRTGDVGCIDPLGYIQITDRAKDVIKSGGEWISSVDLESKIMGHPDVLEAAVIGVPDERWDERPLACVVVKPGSAVTCEELKSFLAGHVSKWWLPERWAFVQEVPKTSVGKFDKKVLRAKFADGSVTVRTVS